MSVSLAAQAQTTLRTLEITEPDKVYYLYYPDTTRQVFVPYSVEDLTFRVTEGGVDELFVIFPDTIKPAGSGVYKGGQIEGSGATAWDFERQAAYDAFFSDAPPLAKPVKPGLWDIDFRSYKVTVPLLLGSGLMDGLNEVLHTHYPRFQARFPGANPGWWNPAVSWENKWKIDADGSVMTGFDRFPGSSTVFVFVTDGYHATRAADHLFLYAGIALNIGERKRWTHYLVDVGLHSLARSIGFNAVYHIAF